MRCTNLLRKSSCQLDFWIFLILTLQERLAEPVSIKQNNLKRITISGFRHTHASLLFESGASLKDVQERLGHGDIQTTSNIYTHVTETQNKKVINNFVAFMKNSPQGESKNILGQKYNKKDTIEIVSNH